MELSEDIIVQSSYTSLPHPKLRKESQPQPDPETEPDSNPASPNPNPNLEPYSKPESDPELEPDSNPDPDSESNQELEPANPEVELEPDSNPYSNSDVDLKLEDSEPESELVSDDPNPDGEPTPTPTPELDPDASSSSPFDSEDSFRGHPNAEIEIVVEDEDNLASRVSTSNDSVWDDLPSPEGQSQVIDVAEAEAEAEALNNEQDPFAEVLRNSMFENLFEDMSKEIRLYRAAMEGEWPEARYIFDADPSLLNRPITNDGESALHLATGAKQTAFVEKLIRRMTPTDVALPDKHGDTALCIAAAAGAVRIAELMVLKNQDLPLVRGFGNVTPLFMAVTYKHRPMVSFLLSVTDLNQLILQEQIALLIAIIHSNFFDIALKILKMFPYLAIMKDEKNNNETALHAMAKKPLAIGTRNELSIWEKCINSCIKGIYRKNATKTLGRQLVEFLLLTVRFNFPEKDRMLEFIKHPTSLLHDAARAANVEFLILLVSSFPDIVWEEDDDGKSIFHVAIENRLENVFNLIHEIGGPKQFSAKYRTMKRKYDMLQLAAKLPASNNLTRVSGAALQMQRELLWFKEVEKIILPQRLEVSKADNYRRRTPQDIFTENHLSLRKEGEKWMKNTAHSCMLVATLITTVVFAAAFTVPGGNDDNLGTPIFQQKPWCSVFVISDAAAFVSSSTSILIFLSILTSRYAEDDFLYLLPSRLLLGLASLFISIASMVVAFSAAFFMLYYERYNLWVPLTIAGMAIVPVSCFCVLQFKLWMDIFHNTYLTRSLFKPRARKLFSGSECDYLSLISVLYKHQMKEC